MVIELRRLAHADINLLRELRNAAADAFFDSRHITVADQEDWWWRYVHMGDILYYTIWLNGVTPVGFLSVKNLGSLFHSEIRIAEIGSLLLAPAYRGQGIMAMAITEVRRLGHPLTFWVAHVKPTNTASLAVFARQKFIQIGSKETTNARNKARVQRQSNVSR